MLGKQYTCKAMVAEFSILSPFNQALYAIVLKARHELLPNGEERLCDEPKERLCGPRELCACVHKRGFECDCVFLEFLTLVASRNTTEL